MIKKYIIASLLSFVMAVEFLSAQELDDDIESQVEEASEASEVKVEEASEVKVEEASEVKVEEPAEVKVEEAAEVKVEEASEVNQQYDLKTFIDYYVDYNKDNRKKTSETLFRRLGSNAESGLLKTATYVTLGYQVRKSTYSFPTELSTRLYKLGNPLMQVDMFESLDRSWAILNSTQARLSQANWMNNIIKANLTINAIKAWNVTRNIPANIDVLLKLTEQVDAELAQLNKNKQNYTEEDWSRTAVSLARIRSDISSLRQFYFSEKANLFNTTGYRKINYKTANADFLEEISCRPHANLQGLELVPEQFRNRIEKIYTEDATDRETTWDISGLAQELSIARLASPDDKGLKVAGNLLAKLISKRLFELNNNRFRSFNRTPEKFFQPDAGRSGIERLDNLKQQLHTVFYNTLRDAFHAEEQAAFIKLNWAKNCVAVDANTVVTSIEIEPTKPKLKNNKKVAKKGTTDQATAQVIKAKKASKAAKEPVNATSENVSDFKVASRNLSKYRVPLATKKQVFNLLTVRGYTIEVLSTRDAQKAAESFKKFDIEHNTLVYWAKKRDKNSDSNYRYTVLVDFFDTSTLNEEKLLEIEKLRDKLGGKIVSYTSVINDLAK